MPIVEIKLVAGRDEAAIKRCVKAVARTIYELLGAARDHSRHRHSNEKCVHLAWCIGRCGHLPSM
jgi:4-oxalocrotonate tautomerase